MTKILAWKFILLRSEPTRWASWTGQTDHTNHLSNREKPCKMWAWLNRTNKKSSLIMWKQNKQMLNVLRKSWWKLFNILEFTNVIIWIDNNIYLHEIGVILKGGELIGVQSHSIIAECHKPTIYQHNVASRFMTNYSCSKATCYLFSSTTTNEWLLDI